MHRRFSAVVTALAVSALVVVVCPVPAFADEVRDDQWHLDALGIDKAHELSQGEGVTVGLIDSGVNADHQDLKGNVKAGKDYGTTGKGLNDESGHGTWTSSLIVGHGHGDANSEGVVGVAPKAKVVSVGNDVGDMEPDKGEIGGDVANAIEWLVDKDVDIISVSMGSQADYRSVDYAVDNNIPVVASAGNCRMDHPMFGVIENTFMTWPASAQGAIPVSGTTSDGDFWDCSVDLTDASLQPKLGLSAPGQDIMGAAKDGGYGAHSGTSAAAPIVAGTLALIKSAYPELTYEQVNERLLSCVDDKGPKGYDDKFGWGIVNPYKALTEDVKHYKGGTSTQDDMVPIDQQGKDQGSHKDGKGSQNSDSLTGATSSSWFIPTAIAVATILAAATVFIIIATKRRTKTRLPSPPPSVP